MSIYRGRTRKEFYLASTLYDSIEDRNLSSIKHLLIEKQADPNLVLPKQGIAPFHLAIGCDCPDFALIVTTIILQNNGNPNVRSDDGLTPLHIAAAWGRREILQLLLSCGGDPEVRDINHKTPLYYARKEGFVDCLELIQKFLPEESFQLSMRENEDCKNAINLILDKIVIQNGITIGEYEVLDKPSINPEILFNPLPTLPESNSTEYIINWFKNQTTKKEVVNETTEFESFSSSIDESDNNHAQIISPESITFRKKYKKTRKIASPNKSSKNTTINENSLNQSSTVIEFSKESGLDILSQTPSLIIEPTKQESSDYLTCSNNSILEKNICEITDDLSFLLTDDSKSIAKKSLTSDTSSVISVSEVYRYEDKENGIILYEQRFLKTPSECGGSLKSSSFSSKLSSLPETMDYDTDVLRKELTTYGFPPGPITDSTKRVYLKKLRQLKKQPLKLHHNEIDFQSNKRVYSVELQKTLHDQTWLSDLTLCKDLEDLVIKQFSNPDPQRKWREGVTKSSFTYLLLDPRKTNNLPCRAELLPAQEVWKIFLSSIFYVGKGKRSRPYSHLYEAVTLWNQNCLDSDNKKLKKILDIWKSNCGVVCLHVFQNIIPVEAYTREAAMISALNLQNVCNKKLGDYYGIAATWPQKQKKLLGVYLLHKAMKIFLNEGERQLNPRDID